jgi:hypothetical protein
MLSTLSSIPGFVWTLLSNHLELVVGYAFCVLFPLPWLNSFIISMWAKVFTKTAVVVPPAV